jgi:hypothetical protein
MEIAKNAIPTLPQPRRLRDYPLNPSAYGVRILRARSHSYPCMMAMGDYWGLSERPRNPLLYS